MDEKDRASLDAWENFWADEAAWRRSMARAARESADPLRDLADWQRHLVLANEGLCRLIAAALTDKDKDVIRGMCLTVAAAADGVTPAMLDEARRAILKYYRYVLVEIGPAVEAVREAESPEQKQQAFRKHMSPFDVDLFAADDALWLALKAAPTTEARHVVRGLCLDAWLACNVGNS